MAGSAAGRYQENMLPAIQVFRNPCMKTRNITLRLPADLLKKAEVYASENDTTSNALVKELLAEKLTGSAQTEAAIRRFLAITDGGPFSKAISSSVAKSCIRGKFTIVFRRFLKDAVPKLPKNSKHLY